jgi:hypothetical protein
MGGAERTGYAVFGLEKLNSAECPRVRGRFNGFFQGEGKAREVNPAKNNSEVKK